MDKKSFLEKHPFLQKYMKELLLKKDLKTHNRVKLLYYYFPHITNNISEIITSMRYPEETFICLASGEDRMPWMDEIYKKRYDKDFNPNGLYEEKFITLKDVFNHFNV